MTAAPRPKRTSAGERFDALFAAGGRLDPHPLYAELREREPVFWSDATNAWVLTRHADVHRLFATEAEFAVLSGEPGATIHGRSLLQMRGRQHRRTKAVIAREIRNLERLDRLMRPVIEGIVDDLVVWLRSASGPVELRTGFTSLLPLRLITWMLGIDDYEDLAGWYRDLALAGVENLVGDPELETRGRRALHKFEALITPVVDAVVADPGEGVLGALARLEDDGAMYSHTELVTLAGFLLTAGVETTDRTMGSLFHRLARHPEEWEALRAEPDLVVPALAETLRHQSAVQGIGRLALVDARFGDIDIAQGTRIIGLIGSGNRDEEVFADGAAFDLERFRDTADRQFTPAADILTFGAGPHHCTGSLLAKLEMSVAFHRVVDEFGPPELAAGSPDSTGVMLRAPEQVVATFHSRTPTAAGVRPLGATGSAGARSIV